MTRRYEKNDVLDVTIEKIVPRGYGIAFVENLTVLVPLAAPGDELRVRIREIRKRTAFAEIVTVSRSGPRRVSPPCELYGRCGGCDMQHLEYKAQLDAKIGIIRDCLERIGKISFGGAIEMVPCPQTFEYRSRARWHIDRENQRLGFYARESHDVIDVAHCPVLTPGLQSSLEYLRESTNWQSIWSEMATIEAASGDEGRVSISSSEGGEPPVEIHRSVGADTYAFSAGTFFQGNKFMLDELITRAIGDVSGNTALDLYCGIGFFTLPLACRFASVLAVEGSHESASFARKNLSTANAGNVRLTIQSVEKFLHDTKVTDIDFVLLDPPRSGTAKTVMSGVARLRPASISYVSCEPSILARDLRYLVDAGYELTSVTAVDMFPQTHHVETIVRLKI